MTLKVIDVLQTLDLDARSFLNNNGSEIKTDEQEAIVVDFINYIGSIFCVDYCMYTEDLKNIVDYQDKFNELDVVEKEKMIGSLKSRIEKYSSTSTNSIIRNKHMNNTNGILEVTNVEIEEFLLEFLKYMN